MEFSFHENRSGLMLARLTNYLTEIVKVQSESQIPFPSNFKDSWVSISSPQKKQRLSFAQVIYFLSKLDQLP